MEAAKVLEWLLLIERGLTTAGTIAAMIEAEIPPEQIHATMQRLERRQANLRAMDLRGDAQGSAAR